MKKLRPLGNITDDLEILLREMTDETGHQMQAQEVVALVWNWLQVHAAHSLPITTDNEKLILEFMWIKKDIK